MDPLRITKTTILNEGDPEAKRAEILDYFQQTFDIEERLYETLRYPETFYLRAEALRHPLIFYFGHTATFFINKLVIAKVIQQRINPRYESMFAVGVDEMSWDDLNEAHYDWPAPDQVRDYRNEARAVIARLIRALPLKLPIHWNDPFWAILMGIEHQRIHLETSSVIIRQLPIDQVQPLPIWEICREWGPAPVNDLLPVSGGTVRLGKERNHPLYGWDNEYGRHEAEVTDFKAARYLVSNAEYKKFVDADGYHEQKWWTGEGWSWRSFKDAKLPLFWIRESDGSFKFRTMVEIIDMPWDWPVEVNNLEAKAFCNWKGAQTGTPIRLPTEDEYHRFCDLADIPDQPWWNEAPGNINLEHFASSCPVDRFRFGDFFDVIGNVWQWTETPIYAFDGFEIHSWYDDFSTPTFDTRHNLIMGGSWISTGNEATRDARYAFRRHFYQHAGFRYVETDAPVVIVDDAYETDALVAQYCEFHYGSEYFGVPNFPVTVAELCCEAMTGRLKGRALDVGCALGRASFELAKCFDRVTGLDFSTRFFRLAADMQERGHLRYALPEEGELVSYHEVRLEDLRLTGVRDKVEFFQADACNLPTKFTGYDLVLAANLIDRLYSPRRFLEMIPDRMNPGGLLVIASPYTWQTEFTKREEWLGGYRFGGENFTTLEGLKEVLEPRFRLVNGSRDIPFVIREHKRKFQHSLSEVTVWELKG